jgi:hypothetical protein
VQSRLGELIGEGKEIWWHARAEEKIVSDVIDCIERVGIPFLDRFSSREKIVAEWADRSENMGAGHPPRIVLAIILGKQGKRSEARNLLALQIHESTRNPGHLQYVRQLAKALGLGDLD